MVNIEPPPGFEYTKPFKSGNSDDNESKNEIILLKPFLQNSHSSTLYVEGLPLDVTVRELTHLFKGPGFVEIRLTFSKTNSRKLCFVEYITNEYAFEKMNKYQGYEFSKNRKLKITFSKSIYKRKRCIKKKLQ